MTRARDVADTQDNVGGSVAPFVAGKNKILNSDFSIWQRGTSFTGGFGGNYGADRWWMANGSGPVERSTDAPSGFAYSIFNNSSGSISLGQAIELPATGKSFFTAGQQVTVSFYAKTASSDSVFVLLYYRDSKFDGTNQSVFTGTGTQVNLTTSWARYSVTMTASAPNATNTVLAYEFDSMGSGTKITGVQIEAGNVATPFTTATGNPASELAACQRYYQRITSAGGDAYTHFLTGFTTTTTNFRTCIQYPVTMRTVPSSIEYGGSFLVSDATTNLTGGAITLQGPGVNSTGINVAVTGATQFKSYNVFANNSNSTYIAFNAEL